MNCTIYDDDHRKLLQSVEMRYRFSSIVHIIYSYLLQSTMISGQASIAVKVNGDNIITDTKHYNIIMTQVLLGKIVHYVEHTVLLSSHSDCYSLPHPLRLILFSFCSIREQTTMTLTIFSCNEFKLTKQTRHFHCICRYHIVS